MIEFEYTIITKPRRKNATITVAPDNSVTIVVPRGVTKANALDILERKKRWIAKRIQQNDAMPESAKPKQFIDGERFLYLGEELTLMVSVHKKAPALRVNDSLCVGVSKRTPVEKRAAVVKRAVLRFYREEARRVLTERVAHYAAILRVTPNTIRIKTLKSRWGSCSTKGNLNFNWKIVLAPLHIIDYLVVHELCHFFEQNHSPRFWAHVAKVLPEHAAYRKWLRTEGVYLTV